MSSIEDREVPRFPDLDPQFQWEGRLNREEGGEESRVFNSLSGRNVGSEPGNRGTSPDDPAALDRFLADNPAMTVRDWKGKGFHAFAPFDKHYVLPNELPWDKLDRDEVRRLATSEKARFLTRGQRMAAGRDPGLEWDERTRSYRLKANATPAPQAATGGGADPYPHRKVRGGPNPRPAAATIKNANTENREGDDA